MRKNYLLLFSISTMLFASCFSNKKVDTSVADRLYKYYNANQDDSILTLLSPDFLEATDSIKMMATLMETHQKQGKILSSELYSTKKSIRYSGKKEEETTLTYKVSYELAAATKEEIVIVYNDEINGKIYTWHTEPWSDN